MRKCAALAVCFIAGLFQVDAAEIKPGECLWQFVTPHGRYHNLVYSVIGKDRAYVVNNSPCHDRQNFVYALDMKTGKLIWETDLGDVCCSEPALGGNRLVIAACDRMRMFGLTFCLDATDGKILWQRRNDDWLSENIGLRFRPVICGNHAVMVSMRKQTGVIVPGSSRLMCLELHDGYQTWHANEASTGNLTRLSEAFDGYIYFGMSKVFDTGSVDTENIYTFSPASGKIREELALPKIPKSGTVLWWTEPLISDGKLYVKQTDGILSCFDLAEKKLAWAVQTDTTSGPPAVSNGIIVLAASSGEVVGLRSKDGREIWKQFVEKLPDELIIHNAQVIVPSRKSVTSLRLDDGGRLWQYDVAKPALDGRPCAAGNVVLVPAAYTKEGISLYALKVAEKVAPR